MDGTRSDNPTRNAQMRVPPLIVVAVRRVLEYLRKWEVRWSTHTITHGGGCRQPLDVTYPLDALPFAASTLAFTPPCPCLGDLAAALGFLALPCCCSLGESPSDPSSSPSNLYSSSLSLSGFLSFLEGGLLRGALG